MREGRAKLCDSVLPVRASPEKYQLWHVALVISKNNDKSFYNYNSVILSAPKPQ